MEKTKFVCHKEIPIDYTPQVGSKVILPGGHRREVKLVSLDLDKTPDEPRLVITLNSITAEEDHQATKIADLLKKADWHITSE